MKSSTVKGTLIVPPHFGARLSLNTRVSVSVSPMWSPQGYLFTRLPKTVKINNTFCSGGLRVCIKEKKREKKHFVWLKRATYTAQKETANTGSRHLNTRLRYLIRKHSVEQMHGTNNTDWSDLKVQSVFRAWREKKIISGARQKGLTSLITLRLLGLWREDVDLGLMQAAGRLC